MKNCRDCGQEKPLELFAKRKESEDGRGAYCYDCKRKRDREHKRKKYGFKPFQPAKPKIKLPPSSKIWVKECEITGRLFVARTNARRFSDDGAIMRSHQQSRNHYIAHRDERRIRDLKVARIRKCNYCNKEYDFINEGSNKYCSDECRDNAQRAIDQNTKTHKVRAEKYRVGYEYINRLKIFKRDKWRCQLCGIKVQKKDHLKDDAAELDHIIPLSRGGDHMYYNVQTLCRKCNGEKNNKLIGQLRIAI